jgi:transposase
VALHGVIKNERQDLLLNDDTIRGWHKLFEQRGIEGLTSFDVGGSASFLSAMQEEALESFVAAMLPRSTRQVGAFIAQEFGLEYESRSSRPRTFGS